MKKEWYIIINRKQEGPFTLLELRRNPYVTPDTLVWKDGFKDWRKARSVVELKQIFQDEEEEPIPPHEKFKPKIIKEELPQDDIVVTLSGDPFSFFIWAIITILVLIYLYFWMNG